MKNCIFVMIATMILVPLFLTAQVFHEAVNQEDFTNAPSINNVTNTGADMVIDDGYSKVMVFDGDVPQFAWETNNGIGSAYFIIDGIWDPDVVLTGDRRYALVCLEEQTTSSIFLSLWSYNMAGAFTEVTGQFGNYTFPYQIAYSGRNPNIDIGYDGKFVITWQSTWGSYEIYAIAGEYSAGQIDLSPDIAFIAPEAHRSPDVSILEDYVSFTFIRDDGNGAESWVVMQADYHDVYSPPQGVLVTPILHQVIFSHLGDNESVFGRPRIASPLSVPAFPVDDFVSVLDFYYEDIDVGIWEIRFVNYHNTSIYGPNIFNDDHMLVPNYEPVVTYTGDLGVVSWTAYIEYPGTGETSFDVVGRYFYSIGNPGNYYSVSDAPIVNSYYHYTETQRTPSVGGRRWNDGQALYFWVDENSNDMAYRVSTEGTINMRKGIEEEASEAKTLGFDISITNRTIRIISELKNYDYQLLDITGRVILRRTSSYETVICLEGISPGIYFIRCQAPNALETRKFFIH